MTDAFQVADKRPQYSTIPYPLIRAISTGAVSLEDVAVYAALDYYRNRRTNTAFPSLRTLAADVRLGRSTVSRCLARLRDAGFVEIEQESRRKPRIYSLRYAPAPKPPSVASVPPVGHSPESECPTSVPNSAPSVPTVKALSTLIHGTTEEKSSGAEAAPDNTPPSAPHGKQRPPEQIAFTRDVDEGLAVWDRELKARGFAAPARVWGRDRKIFMRLVKSYGVEEVAATMRTWLDWRKRTKADATIIGFYSAFERTWQRRHGK